MKKSLFLLPVLAFLLHSSITTASGNPTAPTASNPKVSLLRLKQAVAPYMPRSNLSSIAVVAGASIGVFCECWTSRLVLLLGTATLLNIAEQNQFAEHYQSKSLTAQATPTV